MLLSSLITSARPFSNVTPSERRISIWRGKATGTPAYRAGILSGDRIIKIEGLSTKDMQLTDAVKRMRGKPGSKIVIGIIREGWTEPKDFTMLRTSMAVMTPQ